MFQSAHPADATTRAVLDLVDFLYGNWNRIVLSIAILILAFIVIRVLKSMVTQVGKDYRLPDSTVRLIITAVTYGTVILAFVNVLAVFNIQLYPLILSLGVLSAVVVLGSQLLISNVLGGAVVYVERPFVIGDIIKVGENIGVVQGINIRSTALKGLNGLDITIPNSTFLTTSITNYTKTRHYLVKVPFTMPIKVDLSGLAEAIKARAASIPGFAPDRGGELYKMGISKVDIQYELHFWISDPRKADEAKSRVIDIISQDLGHKGHYGLGGE
ncbi:MAG: Small-conductance mechanosensitive channel MscMJ [Methanocella sp. PtaU1.Bin125]|nr:MAG: Small-conductance mechanosensitive channel MscMJ [Methanocella sp. PtaU1.Bin125]